MGNAGRCGPVAGSGNKSPAFHEEKDGAWKRKKKREEAKTTTAASWQWRVWRQTYWQRR